MRSLLLPLLTLGLALPAQEATTAAAPTSPLVIRTTHEEMAANFSQNFEIEGDLPKLEKGQHWLISLDAAGKPSVKAATGATSTLEIDARPPALMELFKEHVDGAEQMVSMMGMMALQQMGMEAGDAAGLIKDVFAFPKQVATFQLKYRGDPEKPADGFDVAVDLQPVTGTKFAAFCTAIKPNPQGVANLARDGAVNFAASVDLPSVVQQIGPLVRTLSAMSVKRDAKASKEITEKMTKLMDGTMSVACNPGKTLKATLGVTDAAGLQQLMDSPEYANMHKDNATGEAEFTPAALTHNGVKASKTVVKAAENMGDNPMFPDGKMTVLSAVAGKLLVVGGSEGEIKQLIDSAPNAKRVPLPGDALLWVNLKLHDLAATFGSGANDEMPKGIDVTLGKQQNGLGLKVAGK